MRFLHLRYFLAAAKSNSFAAAARSVHLAQPAFSLHIRAFEDELGVPLFTRSNRGVCLTKVGKDMVAHAESILKHAKQAKEEVLSKKDDLIGEVSVAISPSMSTIMLGDLFKEVEKRYPKINLKITDVIRNTAEMQVESGQLDFGLIASPSNLSNVIIEPAISQELYIVGKNFHNKSNEDCFDFSELPQYPLTMGSRKIQLRNVLEYIAISENQNFNVRYEQDSFEAKKSIILAGLAYTVVPYAMFSHEIVDKKLYAKKIINPTINRTLSFTWSRNIQLSQAAQAVKDIIFEKMNEYIDLDSVRGKIIAQNPISSK
jgi:LysR family nitrogen assimilation transcriptional regulator